MLGEPDEAILTYLEVLEMEPDSIVALTALDGLYERQQMWSELADNIGRQLSMAEAEDARLPAQARQRARDAHGRSRCGDRDVPRGARPRRELRASTGGARASGAATRARGARRRILEPLYRDAGQVAKLIGVHEIQVRHSRDADQKVDLLGRMAELYETQLDDLSSAFSSYARALAEEPGNPNTQEQLERIAATANAWQSLAETYEVQVSDTEDAQVAASLHAKVADVRETKLGDIEGAIRHYKRVLELADDNLDAATSLERCIKCRERYEDLAGICLGQGRDARRPEAQKEYFFRAGRSYEEVLDQPTRRSRSTRSPCGSTPTTSRRSIS